MSKLRFCACIAICVAVLSNAQAQSSSLDHARALAGEAAIIVQQGWSIPTAVTRREVTSQRFLDYERLMNEMAAALPPEASIDETENLQNKLLMIARDRAAHPERFNEIRRVYVVEPFERVIRDPKKGNRSLHSPSATDTHASPEYRLAWEFELLCPNRDGFVIGDEVVPCTEDLARAALVAIARIGDERSLVSIRAALEAAFDPTNRRTHLIEVFASTHVALLDVASPFAVRTAAMLIAARNRQLDGWAAARPEFAAGYTSKRITRESLTNLLANRARSNPDQRSRVRTAIQDASADGLTPEAQTALADIKAAAAEAFANDPP